MTAPKIDTQAPERLWLKPCDPCNAPDDYYVCDPLYLDGREVSYVKDPVRCRLCGGGLRRTNGWMTCVECAMTDDFKSAISRPDLAAAQAAAAVEQAFRDGLTYATNCHLFKRAQFDQAWQQSKARERLGDASAALDRLIAERVREAVEAEREACAKDADETAQEADLFSDKHGRQVAERIASIIRARGSKEGRDG